MQKLFNGTGWLLEHKIDNIQCKNARDSQEYPRNGCRIVRFRGCNLYNHRGKNESEHNGKENGNDQFRTPCVGVAVQNHKNEQENRYDEKQNCNTDSFGGEENKGLKEGSNY